MDPRRSESTARALDGDTLSGMFLAGGPGVPPQHPTRPPFLDRAAHSRPHRLVLQRADPLPAYARLTEARSPAPSHCCFTTSLLPDCPKAGSSQWDRSGWQTGEDPHTCDPAVHGRQVLCLRYCCSDAPFTLGCCGPAPVPDPHAGFPLQRQEPQGPTALGSLATLLCCRPGLNVWPGDPYLSISVLVLSQLHDPTNAHTQRTHVCTEAAVRALEAAPGAAPAEGDAGLWRTSGAVTSLSTGKGREQESWSPKQVTRVDADLKGWARGPPSKWEQETPGPSSILRARGIQVPRETGEPKACSQCGDVETRCPAQCSEV